MKTTARTRSAPQKLERQDGAKKTGKAKEAAQTEKVTLHTKDRTDAGNVRQKTYDAKVGGGVEVSRTGAHQGTVAPLRERVNKALDQLGITVGLRVQPYDSGDWMDYAHSKKADRAVQVITLGETQTRYVLEERKEPDRLVLLNEGEHKTEASALLSDFGSFTEALQSVLARQLDEAAAIRERLLNPAPRSQAQTPKVADGPRRLSSDERVLLEAEAKQLHRDVTSLKQEIDGISKRYGYTRPWAMDEGRSEFTLVNGRFDVLGYKDHLRKVEADQSKFDALTQQHAQKSGQLDLKLAQLKTGLATDV